MHTSSLLRLKVIRKSQEVSLWLGRSYKYFSSRTEPCFVEWSRQLRVITSGNLSASEDNTSIVHLPSVPISLVTTGSVYY